MKKTAVLSMVLCICLLLSACGVKVHGTNHYQKMYEIIKDWNRASSHDREDLYGYGEYLYQSYLLLFPRETPSTLTDYSFLWDKGMDVDTYNVYFTCKLSEDSYRSFIEGLDSFSITKDGETHYLLKNEEAFSYPAYIIQWVAPGHKNEALEYILLDDENQTVIFVYFAFTEKAFLDKKAAYDIMPKVDLKEVVDASLYNVETVDLGGMEWWMEGYSVYFPNNMENAVYDLSFLDLLNE